MILCVNLCVCMFDIMVNSSKMAEPIRMPFGAELHGSKEPRIRWGSISRTIRDTFDGGMTSLICPTNWLRDTMQLFAILLWTLV